MKGTFQDAVNKSNNDSYLGMGLWGSSKPILLPPVAASMPVFKTNVVIRLLLVCKATTELERRCELGKSNARKLTVLYQNSILFHVYAFFR